jgi:hypothetical protein
MNPILIYAKNRQGFDGLFRVLEALEIRGQTNIALTTDDGTVRQYSKTFRADLPQRFIEPDDAANYRWAAIVATHLPPANLRPNGPLMIIPHGSGFGIGGMYNQVLANSCDIYFGCAPGELDYFKQYGGDEFPADRFVPVGSPHTDALAGYANQGEASRRILKQEIGLDPDIPVILVTSHWTPDSILRTWGLETLAALEPLTAQYCIVQSAHRGIWDFPVYDTFRADFDTYKEAKVFDSKTLYQELHTYCRNRSRVRFLPDLDTWKMLAISDLLIGDYSSIITEYCVFDRPIVFSNRRDRFSEEINYQRYAAACGAADSPDELVDAVTRELASPEQRSNARKELADTFIWNLGNAAAKTADEIIKRI